MTGYREHPPSGNPRIAGGVTFAALRETLGKTVSRLVGSCSVSGQGARRYAESSPGELASRLCGVEFAFSAWLALDYRPAEGAGSLPLDENFNGSDWRIAARTGELARTPH